MGPGAQRRDALQQSRGLAKSWLLTTLVIGLAITSLCNLYFLQSTTAGANHHHNPVRSALSAFTLPVAFNNETKEELIQRLYPHETAIPNPPLSDGKTAFAGCLLVMDDNHRLMEWLAYHYHVLPLRQLIVAVDPRSEMSPTHIFNRWRRYGIHITEWGDGDFWIQKNGQTLRDLPSNATFQMKRDRHRGRQKYFYKKCLIELKKQGRTWVTLHDSDEYIVYNHKGGKEFEAWESSRRAKNNDRIQPSMIPPTTAEEGAMIRYIEHERAAGLSYYQSPCIGIPRLMFGADSTDEHVTHGVPEGLKDYVPSMDTLYWRRHATRNDFSKNALGKVILDVSRVDVARTPYFMSLHRPIKTICSTPWHKDGDSGLRINHYLGSWESYSFRDNDSRKNGERSWESWEYKATTIGENTDDNIRPWVSGLAESQGIEKAREMLQDIGLPPTYKSTNIEAWKLRPDKLEEVVGKDESNTRDNKLLEFAEWLREKYGYDVK
jgi:hypothetical protein